MIRRIFSAERIVFVALVAACLGVFGVWVPHRVVGLRQNAIDLAEWATFLPEVRGGILRYVPDLLRLAVALAVVASVIQAARNLNRWVAWGVRLLALIAGVLLMPPYPFVLQLWGSDAYSLRFLIASLVLIGVAASLLTSRLPERIHLAVLTVLSLLGLALSTWAFISMAEPFAIRYSDAISPGWGAVTFFAGLAIAGLFEAGMLVHLITSRSDLSSPRGNTPAP